MLPWVLLALTVVLGVGLAAFYRTQLTQVQAALAAQAEILTNLNAVIAQATAVANQKNHEDQTDAAAVHSAPGAAGFLNGSLSDRLYSDAGTSTKAKLRAAGSPRRPVFVRGFARGLSDLDPAGGVGPGSVDSCRAPMA
jgi:hypothetical protein